MQRYIIVVTTLLLVSGCVHPQHPGKQQPSVDILLLEAKLLESQGLYTIANKYYKKIYKITDSPIILEKMIENSYMANRLKDAEILVKDAIRKFPTRKRFYEQLGTIYYAMKEYEKAAKYIQKALELAPSAKDYEFLGSIYLMQKKYQLALKYYKSAYSIHPSAKSVNSIAYIMFFYLDKQKEAIAYLETHTRIYGCQKSVCHTLASFYGLLNDIDGLISVYKRLYEKYKEKSYAKKVGQFLIYKKDYVEAKKWAQKIGEKELLLSIYKLQKDYKKAFEIAMRLYEEKKEAKFLAQAAIFEFESAKKRDKKLLKSVAAKLEKAIQKIKDPIYLNYLGYLYIDYDIDIKRGIKLVKEALQKEPNSPYYLDSLAWGYYKIGRCKEALSIIKKVYYDLRFQDDEIQLHLNKISKCAKEKR